MAKALVGLGHEVRLVVSNAGGPTKVAVPVANVPFRRLWPGMHGWLERLRGRMAPIPEDVTRILPLSTAQGTHGGMSRDQTPGMAGAQAGLAGEDALSAFEPIASGGAPWMGGTNSPLGPDGEPGADGTTASSWKLRFYYQDLPRLVDRCDEFFFHPAAFARVVASAMETFRPHAVYERYALGQSGAARAVRSARVLGSFPETQVPHLLEVNASLAQERVDLSGPWAWWGRMSEKRIWRKSDRVLCVSDRLRDLAARSGADTARIRVIPNGVDVEAFSPDLAKGALRASLGVSGHEMLVGWLGSLSKGRGAEEFLRILALLLPYESNVRGVVIGGGSLAGECRDLASRLGIAERVSFLGPVDHERVPGLLVDLDVAVACYPRQEGFYFSPMKLGEYLACGLPVVAGRVGQMLEMVEDGVNGVLAEPGNLSDWARQVAGLCRDPKLRTALGQGARLSALAGPTWENNARMVEREILECRRQLSTRTRQ
jgi:glycosyltransferase involved in cell wall biosynthesis